MRTRWIALLPFTLLALSSPASAQSDNRAVMERMNSIERNLMILQRQVATGEAPAPGELGGMPADAGLARLEARLAGIEEQLRILQGKIEEQDYKNQRLASDLEKLSKDIDFRLNALQTAAAAAPAPAEQPTTVVAPMPQAPAEAAEAEAQTPTPKANIPAPAPAKNLPAFESARDHYNHAFKLLNQAKYADAASAFDAFIAQYPKDALTGNAYYWLGETYYVRRDYVKAADYFRQGFEALPKGPKAADNLLKLAMSLDALKQTKESCVVLGQLLVKFGSNSETIREKAETEQKRIGCE